MSDNKVNTVEVLRMLKSGCTPLDVARKLGVSPWHIRIVARENGFGNCSGPKSRVKTSRLRELVEMRSPLGAIAAEFGVRESTVIFHMRNLGFTPSVLNKASDCVEAAE
jgi:hypothetical protein